MAITALIVLHERPDRHYSIVIVSTSSRQLRSPAAMKRQYRLTVGSVLGVIVVMFACRESWGVSASPHPVKVTQPDGRQVRLFLRGDEHFHFYEDEHGYTVIRDDEA